MFRYDQIHNWHLLHLMVTELYCYQDVFEHEQVKVVDVLFVSINDTV